MSRLSLISSATQRRPLPSAAAFIMCSLPALRGLVMRSKLSCKEKEGIHLGWYSKACLLIHSYHKPATTQLLASWTSVLKTIKIHHHLLFVYSCWCDLLFFGTYVLSCVCASLSVLVGLCVSVFLSLSALRVNDYFLKPEHNLAPFALPIALSIAPYTFACALPIWKLGRRFFRRFFSKVFLSNCKFCCPLLVV